MVNFESFVFQVFAYRSHRIVKGKYSNSENNFQRSIFLACAGIALCYSTELLLFSCIESNEFVSHSCDAFKCDLLV